MDAYLKELQGTMARDAQRKKTMLNVIERQRREKHRNRFGTRPLNPLQTVDVEAARHFFFEVQGEYAAKCRELIDANFEVMGENSVRQLNETANRLLREVARWERRVTALGGVVKILQVNKDARSAYASGKTLFIGAAKKLPEALKQQQQQQQQQRQKQADGADSQSDSGADAEALANGEAAAPPTDPMAVLARKLGGQKSRILTAIDPEYLTWERSPDEERELRKIEARLELAHSRRRAEEVQKRQRAADDAAVDDEDAAARYIRKFERVPTDEEVNARLVELRKAEIRSRLATTK